MHLIQKNKSVGKLVVQLTGWSNKESIVKAISVCFSHQNTWYFLNFNKALLQNRDKPYQFLILKAKAIKSFLSKIEWS